MPSSRHLHREGRLDQRAHRADAPVGDQGAARAPATRSSSRRCRRSTASAIPRRTSRWCCTWSRGDRMDQRQLLRRLADMQYTRNELDLHAGTYRVRGDVIDVFPAESEREARAHRAVRRRDRVARAVRSAHRRGRCARCRATRCSRSTHYVTPRERLIGAIDEIKDELRERLERAARRRTSCVEAQRLEQRTHVRPRDDDARSATAPASRTTRAICRAARRASRRRACSTTCRGNALLVVDESHVTIPQLGAMYQGRPLAQGDAGRVRLPAAVGARQPAAEVRGVGAARAADDLRVGDAGPYELRALGAGRRAGGAADRPGRSGGRGAPGRARRSTTCCRRSRARASATSACWSRR